MSCLLHQFSRLCGWLCFGTQMSLSIVGYGSLIRRHKHGLIMSRRIGGIFWTSESRRMTLSGTENVRGCFLPL